jgi:hypothetical protein
MESVSATRDIESRGILVDFFVTGCRVRPGGGGVADDSFAQTGLPAHGAKKPRKCTKTRRDSDGCRLICKEGYFLMVDIDRERQETDQPLECGACISALLSQFCRCRRRRGGSVCLTAALCCRASPKSVDATLCFVEGDCISNAVSDLLSKKLQSSQSLSRRSSLNHHHDWVKGRALVWTPFPRNACWAYRSLSTQSSPTS